MGALKAAGIALTLAVMLLAGGPAVAQPKIVKRGDTGVFDYYVLSLSWSPGFCNGRKPDQVQCGTGLHYGFVVHGLWPQYDKGGWPEYCVLPVPPASEPAIATASRGNPSRSLFAGHEWPKHGTCATTSSDEYAANGLAAFEAFATPPRLKQHPTPARAGRDDLRAILLQSNPTLPTDGLKLQCRKGALQEIHVCLDKGLKPRACARDVKDSCPASVHIDPVP